jgi:hypothetical protein
MYPRKSRPDKDSSDFTVYHPLPFVQYPPLGYQTGSIPDEGTQAVSIDPGIVNFAIRIERRFQDGRVNMVWFDKINFDTEKSERDTSESARVSPIVIFNMTNYFLSLMPMLIESRIVAFEHQIEKYPKMLRVFQHWLTLFLNHIHLFKYPCTLVEVSAKLKTTMLGAPKKLDKNERKKWDIAKALELLEIRQDNRSIDIIKYHKGTSKTKADDLADTVIQLEALILLWGG